MDTPDTHSLDPNWIHRYDAIPFTGVDSNEWYGVAGNEEALYQRQIARSHFIASNTISNPDLHFPKLDSIDFRNSEIQLQELLVDAVSLPEGESDVRYEQAARKLAELYRHKEVVRSLGLHAERLAVSKERASAMTLEIFGSPRRDAFMPMVAALRAKAEKLQSHQIVASELLEMLGQPDTVTPETSIELLDETLNTLRNDLLGMMPSLNDWLHGDREEVMGLEGSKEHFEKLLDITGLSEASWRVAIISGSIAASTNKKEKVISIGEARLSQMTRDQLQKTAVHETIGHAMREKTGLPGGLAFEEGFGTALEQIVSGNKRIPGEQYYTALALQLGLDRGGQKRTFREVYEILWRRIVVEQLHDGKPEDFLAAKQKAYTQCMRTTRGGALDARDISYSNGANKAQPWLNHIATLPTAERHRILKRVMAKSYDPTDSIHVAQMENV